MSIFKSLNIIHSYTRNSLTLCFGPFYFIWGPVMGNSTTALYRHLCVKHTEHCLGQSTMYLSVQRNFVTQDTDHSSLVAPLPQMVPVPCPSWLLSVYAKDVLSRLPELKARVTSVYGSILKMDSTKKVKPDLVLFFIVK